MTALAAEQLSDDPEALKALLLQQSEKLGEQARLLTERNSQLQNKQQRIQLLEEQILLLRNRQFGSSSEKAPGQGELFNEAEQAESETV